MTTSINALDVAFGNRNYTDGYFLTDNQTATASLEALNLAARNLLIGTTGIWIDAGTVIYPINATSIGISDSGYLGIGTTNPATALEVAGEIRGQRFAFQDDTNTYIDTLGSDKIVFVTNGTNQVVIDSNGNVGIGNTGPVAKLSIGGATSTISNSSGNISITPNGNLIVTAGNMGIGTTNPSEVLHVVGSGRFTAVSSGSYSTSLNRTADGTFTTQSSDARLKTNIEPLGGVLDKVLAIETHSFNWIDNSGPAGSTNFRDIGFIAQEMEQIFPALTFTNPTDGYMGIRYDLMTTYLTKAIQEQQGIIVQNANAFDLQMGNMFEQVADLQMRFMIFP